MAQSSESYDPLSHNPPVVINIMNTWTDTQKTVVQADSLDLLAKIL